MINVAEVINAYSELVDPVDKKNWLMVQAGLKAAGDDEAIVMDDDYIRAMEYGDRPDASGFTGRKIIKELILLIPMLLAES